MLKAGCSRRAITPKRPLRLAGYGDRTGVYDGKYEDIFLRALYLEGEGAARSVIVSADILWWSPDIMRLLSSALSSIGYSPDEVAFTATHNHSGPGTGNAFLPALETGDRDFMEMLVSSALAAIKEAEEKAESASVKAGKAQAPLNVYRRLSVGGSIQMRPNYNVAPDSSMTAISFWRDDGSMLSCVVHFACHSNLSHENMLQRDYPGILVDKIEEKFPSSTALFLQGCTGDMRPNSVVGDRFVAASRENVIKFGNYAFEYALSALENSSQVTPHLKGFRKFSAPIPVVQDFSKANVDDEVRRQWKEKAAKKERPELETFCLKRLDIGDLRLLFANGELVKAYAAYAAEFCQKSIVAAYSDGMIGYIADRRQLAEGGYEAIDFAPWFAVAGYFSDKTEEIVKALIKEALE